MFRRANKVAALLVAAASIMSVVPAMAADTTRLGNREGTIKQGIAFGSGTYSYYGYRTDSNDTGIYYNNDGGNKDKFNDELEDYRFNNDSKFGSKYAYAKDNSNGSEYLVDLSTGKIVDDETVEEKADSAKDKLVSKIKRADRYNSVITSSSDMASMFDSAYSNNTTAGKFTQILPGEFGDVWYQFKVTTNAAAKYTFADEKGNATTSAANYIGFSDENGNYVDLTKETNLRVFSSKTGRAEYIKEYGKLYNDSQLKVDLIDVIPLAQDKDNIYTLTKVAVTDSNKDTLYNNNHLPQLQFFVQKISKAQGGKDDDGAYTAKNIDSYQLQAPNQNGINNEIYDDDNFAKAYNALLGTGDSSDEKLLGISVKDGNLYVATAVMKNINTQSEVTDKLEIWKLKLGKFKENVKIGGLTLRTDVDTNLVSKDDDTDDGDILDFNIDYQGKDSEDDGIKDLQLVGKGSKYGEVKIAGRSLYRLPSVSIDTNGVIWGLEKGKVVKFDGLTKKAVYTVDRAMNAIDVYDDNNLLVWDSDGDVYTNISEGHKVTEDDGKAVDPNLGQAKPPITVGWKQETSGWTFYDVNGNKKVSDWVYDNGTWYYMKSDGFLATGWQLVKGNWYYLSPVSGGPLGAMYSNRWAQDSKGLWYYLNSSGAMVYNQWIQSSSTGAWYYVGSDGAMVTNTVVDGYRIGWDGAWIQ